MDREKLRIAMKLISDRLVVEGYYDQCKCRSCDALRPFAKAHDILSEIHTEEISKTLLGEDSQASSQAQKRAEEVGGRKVTLAHAKINTVTNKWELSIDKNVVFTGYAQELIKYCMINDYDIRFGG